MDDESNVAVARAAYQAYVTKDRSSLEALIADDFHFTSPLDNRIDRDTYFERCWPNSERSEGGVFLNTRRRSPRIRASVISNGPPGPVICAIASS